MSARLPLADIQFIADFAAFARSKGAERYNYCEPTECALALFLKDSGLWTREELPCGLDKSFLGEPVEWWNAPYPSDLNSALAGATTFSVLADRLEALIADAPSIGMAREIVGGQSS